MEKWLPLFSSIYAFFSAYFLINHIHMTNFKLTILSRRLLTDQPGSYVHIYGEADR